MTTATFIATSCAGTSIELPDGGSVAVRPLERGEIEPQLCVLREMSEAARYQRFLTAMPPRLPARMMTALSDVDGHRHVAVLASVDGRPVGVARYVLVDVEVAELAFEVVDAHQGRGIGSALLDTLAAAAAARGVRRFSASVLPGNTSSVRLLRRVGLQLRLVDGLLQGESPLRVDHLVGPVWSPPMHPDAPRQRGNGRVDCRDSRGRAHRETGMRVALLP